MKNIYSYLLFLVLIVGCKEDYDSPFNSPNTGFLVVEGAINSGQGRTTIKLSRTAKLENQLLNVQYEKGASVRVEGEDNSSYGLNETSEGNYTANNLNLNNAVKYRLHIRTLTGKEYMSDYAAAQASPEAQGDLEGRFFINPHILKGLDDRRMALRACPTRAPSCRG